MFMNQLKWWVVLTISIILVIILVPSNLLFSIKENTDRYEAEKISRDYLQKNGVELGEYQPIITRQVDYNTLNYLYKGVESGKMEELIKNDILPNNRWQVRFLRNLPTDQSQTRYHVWISPQGNIIGYMRQVPDTLTLPSEIEARALAIARYYVSHQTSFNLNNFAMKKSQQNRQMNRTDYVFVWEKPADFIQGIFRLTLFVQGNEIGGYEYQFIIPEQIQTIVSNKTTQGTLYYFVQFIILIFVFVYALIIFLRKYHEGEISVTRGRNLFIIIFSLGLLGAVNGFPVSASSLTLGNLTYQNTQILVFLYQILVQSSFLGVLLLTSWAVGEAYARRYAPEKLNSIDSILNKKFFTAATGSALLRGGAIGFLIAAFYLAFVYLITGKDSEIVQVFFPTRDSFEHILPLITIFKGAVLTALISEVVFRFFIINISYNRWKNKGLAIILSALSWTGVVFILSNFPHVSNYLISLSLTFLIGILLAWLYFKYDLLTLIAINMSSQIVFISIPLYASANNWHNLSAYL